MNPFAKGRHIAIIGHLLVVALVVVGILISNYHAQHRRAAGAFSVSFASPSNQATPAAPRSSVAASKPKLAAVVPESTQLVKPATSKTVSYKDFKKANPTKLPKVDTPKVKTAPQNKVISYKDFQKSHPLTPTTTTTTTTAATSTPSGPSFTDRLSQSLQKSINQAQSSGSIGPSGNPGTLSGMGGTDTDAESIYVGMINNYLNTVWNEPKQLGGVKLHAKVAFEVDRDGNILSYKITSSSGSAEFDQSIRNIFAKISRVSAPPIRTNYRLSVEFETHQSSR